MDTINSVKVGCENMTMNGFPTGVSEIGREAFREAKSINPNIPESVTAIESGAFWGCTDLSWTVLPSGLITIEDSAFRTCENLAVSAFPETLTTIGSDAFAGCSKLSASDIPESVTAIGDYAFNNCPLLQDLSGGEGVTTIGEHVYYIPPFYGKVLTDISGLSSAFDGYDWTGDNRYIKKEFKVVYDKNGGDIDAPVDTATYKTGDTVLVKSFDGKYGRHDFRIWNTEPDGTGSVYNAGTDLETDMENDGVDTAEGREIRLYAIYGLEVNAFVMTIPMTIEFAVTPKNSGHASTNGFNVTVDVSGLDDEHKILVTPSVSELVDIHDDELIISAEIGESKAFAKSSITAENDGLIDHNIDMKFDGIRKDGIYEGNVTLSVALSEI